MGIIARGTKSTGGTALQDGATIIASELNTDFDTIITDYNGSIADANISASAAIETSKIDGYSDNVAEAVTTASPGTSDSESLAATLAGELQRLRYAVERIGLGNDAVRVNGSGTTEAAWYDVPARAVNLIPNGDFIAKSTASPNAPEYWSLENTPTTCNQVAAGIGEAQTRALNLVSDAANEGVKFTLNGLKASTKYLLVARAKATSGTAKIVTSGADGASPFRDLTLTTTSAAFVTLKGVFATDGTPTSVTVKLLAAGNGDDVTFTGVRVYECNADVVSAVGGCSLVSSSNSTATTYTNAGWTDGPASSIAVVVPSTGYEIEIEASIVAKTPVGGGTQFQGRIIENGSLAGSLPCVTIGAASQIGTVTCKHINTTPTPGTTYTYKMQGRCDNGNSPTSNGTPSGGGDATQSVLWVKVRRVA